MINNYRKKANHPSSRPNYLRYDDVFIKKPTSSKPSIRSQPQSQRRSSSQDAFPSSSFEDESYNQKKDYRHQYRDSRPSFSSSKNTNPQSRHEEEYIEENYIQNDDQYNDEAYAEEQFVPQKDPREYDYFAPQSELINEKMVRFQKAPLPPLQRYKPISPSSRNKSRNNYETEYDYYDDENQDDLRANSSRSLLGVMWQKFFITFAGVFTLVCVAWIAYHWNGNKSAANSSTQSTGTLNGVPLLEPQDPVFKVLPENPGGQAISNKNKAIYERVNPGIPALNSEDKLLPDEIPPAYIPDAEDLSQETQPNTLNQQPQESQQENNTIAQENAVPQKSAVSQAQHEEYSIIDEKLYYIKVTSGSDKVGLIKESQKLIKIFSQNLNKENCHVKKVSNSSGVQKYAILVGPFDSQSAAVTIAKGLNKQGCSIITVKNNN